MNVASEWMVLNYSVCFACLQSYLLTLVSHFSANYMKDVYMAPWCRIGPYIIGLMVGYILYKTKRIVNLHMVKFFLCTKFIMYNCVYHL